MGEGGGVPVQWKWRARRGTCAIGLVEEALGCLRSGSDKVHMETECRRWGPHPSPSPTGVASPAPVLPASRGPAQPTCLLLSRPPNSPCASPHRAPHPFLLFGPCSVCRLKLEIPIIAIALLSQLHCLVYAIIPHHLPRKVHTDPSMKSRTSRSASLYTTNCSWALVNDKRICCCCCCCCWLQRALALGGTTLAPCTSCKRRSSFAISSWVLPSSCERFCADGADWQPWDQG